MVSMSRIAYILRDVFSFLGGGSSGPSPSLGGENWNEGM